jgi:hypothetical protein
MDMEFVKYENQPAGCLYAGITGGWPLLNETKDYELMNQLWLRVRIHHTILDLCYNFFNFVISMLISYP